MSLSTSTKLFLTVGCLFLAVGCNGSAETEVVEDSTPVVNLTLTDTHKANLAAADKLDGAEDKVVHRCYSCALGMDGDAANAAKVGDYELHFCSEGCVDNFVGSADDVLATTGIPKE